MAQRLVFILFFFTIFSLVHAQLPSQLMRPIPPPGVEIPAADRTELESGVAALGKEIDALKVELKDKPKLLELLPDVQIFFNAVRYALKYNEFLNLKEIPLAKEQLKQGMDRAKELRAGKPSWTTQTGLVVRGYVSKIDGSVQPYGLVVPPTFQPNLPYQYRLDIWYRGRSETMTEINFIADRQKNPGQFTPLNTIVLHPYGRYCNANKFAGEVDTFEALENVRKNYQIDENRISVRGFSMGGAATWHIAAHNAGLWASAAPGAGFVETAEYIKADLKDVPEYEQKLWNLTNASSYAGNFFNLPVVAYSGELDRQKQAADVMAREMKKEGIELTHIIGPKTEHKYHPDSIPEINKRIDSIVAKGRDPIPKHVKFTTYTLRYNKMFWVTVDGLEQHWEKATIDAEIKDAKSIEVRTKNITSFTVEMPVLSPMNELINPIFIIDGIKLKVKIVHQGRVWSAHFLKAGKYWVNTKDIGWQEARVSGIISGLNRYEIITVEPKSKKNKRDQVVLLDKQKSLLKSSGLQGPIDDAFMNRFIFVRPTGKASNEAIAAWVDLELNRAIQQWRAQFRGEAIVKNDDEITVEDIAKSNLILWGDASSNKILEKIADKLPIKWNANNIQVGKQNYSSSQHIPILIYPNPLNPNRYIVLNSGFTFREADILTNAKQTAKLPDWAIIDITTLPSFYKAGNVVNAGFFGERWELKY
jgi:Prolyl oligopeptidase family